MDIKDPRVTNSYIFMSHNIILHTTGMLYFISYIITYEGLLKNAILVN